MWGSNYPSSNSGPPPPPGGGGGYYGQQAPGYGYGQQQQQYSAYNNQSAYGGAPGGYGGYGGGYGGAPGGYPMGSQAPPGYGGYGQQQSGAVAGFTAPAMGQYQQQPPMQQPVSMQYNAAAYHTAQQGLMYQQMQHLQNMGLVEPDPDEEEDKQRRMRRRRRAFDEEDEEEEDMEEKSRQAEARAQRAEEKAKELQEKLANNEGMKADLRHAFLQELVRRQKVSGTFEVTQGTVHEMKTYAEDDPVAKWMLENRGDDIVGKKWDAENDVQYLREAMKGFGTDEQALIDVVTTRSNRQRNTLLIDFKTAYGRDLIEDLVSETSGNFREVLIALFETPARYDAWSIKKAIYGLGTDEQTLIEILFTRTNAQIKEMVQEYNNITYAKRTKAEASIEEDIKDDCSGDFKRLLIAATTGNRKLKGEEDLEACVEPIEVDGNFTGLYQINYEKLCDVDRCKRMAKELHVAGEEKLGTDEETFNRIFSTQDFYTLRVIYDQYVKLSQRDIMNSVDRETSGNYKKGLLAIVQSVKCRPMFFAERLYHAMKGLGTKDSTLIRIVISRSELDMVQIKQCFLEKYHQTLWKFIKDDTSGDYRKILCSIVGRD